MKLKLLMCLAVVVFCAQYYLIKAQDLNVPDAQGAEQRTAIAENLVVNAGFEQGTKPWKIPAKAQATIDKNISYSGNASLHYKRGENDGYNFISQTVKARPGTTVHFGAYIKGKNIRGRAAVVMQSSDKDGKYLGGSFPIGITGTFDWELVKGIYKVPTNAATVSVAVLLKNNTTGNVWFDDVYVQEEKRSFARVDVKNYRGYINRNEKTPLTAHLEINLPPAQKSVTLQHQLKSVDGKVLFEAEKQIPTQNKKAVIEIEPQTSWEVGDYHWNFTVQGANAKYQKLILVKVRDEMPNTYIDLEGFTVIDGKRFFPFGIYTGRAGKTDNPSLHASAENLKQIADAGFNTVLSYSHGISTNQQGPRFLDLAQRHNLKVIYSLAGAYFFNKEQGLSRVQQHVQDMKGHPALLSWYLNDEKEDYPHLARMYRTVAENDPDHPAFQMLYQVHLLDNFYESTDVIGTDPYPIRQTSNINMVSQWTQLTNQSARDVKGVWQALQIHNMGYFGSQHADRDPTLEEMQNMSYQALINGSKGLLYYAYHSLFYDFDANGNHVYSEDAFNKHWPDVQALAREIEPLTKVILKNQKVDLKGLSPSTAQHQAWQDGNKLYIAVVNSADYEKDADLSLEIPAGWRVSHVSSQLKGIDATLQAGVLRVKLAPVASGVVVIER